MVTTRDDWRTEMIVRRPSSLHLRIEFPLCPSLVLGEGGSKQAERVAGCRAARLFSCVSPPICHDAPSVRPSCAGDIALAAIAMGGSHRSQPIDDDDDNDDEHRTA
jgi:hypothetical protein